MLFERKEDKKIMPTERRISQLALNGVLFAVFDKGICKASRFDLAEYGVGICLDSKRAKLDAVILLRCDWSDGSKT